MKLTKEHIEQTIAYLQEQLKLVEPKIEEQPELIERKPKTIYDLEVGDEYYCFDEQDEIKIVSWYNTKFNLNQRSRGNCFLTVQEAQEHLDYIIAKGEYLEFIREWNGDRVIDWNSEYQRKCFLTYYNTDKEIGIDSTFTIQDKPSQLYYLVDNDSQRITFRREVITKLGEDKVILAITGEKL